MGPCSEDRVGLIEECRGRIPGSDVLVDFGYRKLKTALEHIGRPGDVITSYSDLKGRQVLARADVVLFGSVHDRRELLVVLRRLIFQVLEDSQVVPADLAVLLECIPVHGGERQDEAFARLRAGDTSAVRSLLKSNWPWPIEGYVGLLRDLIKSGVQVIPIGVDHSASVPADSVPDDARRPSRGSMVHPRRPSRWRQDFDLVSIQAASAARDWLERDGGRGRKVVIDCGLLHHLWRDSAILERLREAGLEVVLDIGFVKAIELALVRRFGDQACEQWFELGPGLIRSPYARVDRLAQENR